MWKKVKDRLDILKIILKVSTKRALQWCNSKGNIPYFEASAKESTTVESAFNTISKNALARESTVEFADFPDPITLSPESRVGSNCC